MGRGERAFSILLRLGRLTCPGLKWILASKKMQGATMDALPETLVSLLFYCGCLGLCGFWSGCCGCAATGVTVAAPAAANSDGLYFGALT